MTAGYPGDRGSTFQPMADAMRDAGRAAAAFPGPRAQPKTVHLSWRSAWRVGVMVWVALCAFAMTAVVVSAVAAAMLAASLQP